MLLATVARPSAKQGPVLLGKSTGLPGFHWLERSRLLLTWIRSHSSEEAFRKEFGEHELWRMRINERADALCRLRADGLLNIDHVDKVKGRDELVRQISLFLAARAEKLLASAEAPRPHLQEDPSVRFTKKRRGGPKLKQQNQHRPGEDGGLNKRERLKLMVSTGAGGHDWKWNDSANASITCSTCTLFVEQIMSLDKFGVLEKHPCRHREAVWNPLLPKHGTHQTYNLGHVWICVKCHGVIKAGASCTPPKLLKACDGKKLANKVLEVASASFT